MDTAYATCERTDVSSEKAEALSYKFQRLREKLRQAVVGGEFAGKLPGERELARRFNANPKTLGKALSDLAAEGLLERRIGRGTYVRDAAPARATGRWLVLCDPPQQIEPSSAAVLAALRSAHADAEVVSAAQRLRPSMLAQFKTVVDASRTSGEEMLRDLLVRGMDIVLVDREPGPISVHTVTLDRRYAAWRLAQQIFMAAHRRIAVVDRPGETALEEGARAAAGSFGAEVQAACVDEFPGLASGCTAVICDVAAVQALRQSAPATAGMSVGAVGVCDQPTCSGIYVSSAEVEQAVSDLLRDAQMHRPVALHLTGAYTERGSIGAGASRALSA